MKNFILKSINTILILIIIFAPLRFDFLYIQRYVSALNGEDLYIEEDVVWNNDTDLSEYGTVYIINDATVTIEAGSNIEVRNIVVEDVGRIVAVGDINNKIVFTKLPALEIGEYDSDCSSEGVPTFEFYTYASDDFPVEESFFKFVEFNGLGEYFDYNNLHCPEIVMNKSIINSAYAQDVPEIEPDIRKAPTILYHSGMVTMENVIFNESSSTDIIVDMELEEGYNENSYLHIKNSNFNGSNDGVAINSNVFEYDWEMYDACYEDCADSRTEDWDKYYACCDLCELRSKIHDSSKVVLENNWYGNSLGPTGDLNDLNGEIYTLTAGEKLSGDLTIESYDWRPSPDFASNVLFLPGTKASELYTQDDQVWPPEFGENDYKRLLLDADGNSIEDLYTDNPIDEAGLPSFVAPNIYKRFLGDLKELKDDNIITDYIGFAYDWRKSVDDIAKNGTSYKMSSMKNPISEAIRLADSSVSGKVTIVAHSNGGLLAKAIIQQLEILKMTDKIDNIVMVSSPQMGTPKAILTMLYGYEERPKYTFGFITDAQAREVAENMPSAYGLLPTEEYFRRVDEPIINFTSENSENKKYKDAYGDTINSYQEFKDFLLAKKDNRQKPDKNDTDRANVLNEKLFDENKELHEELNNWVPPENINLIQIGGWGLDTESGINYESIIKSYCKDEVTKEGIKRSECKDVTLESYIPKYTIDGDDVVVTPSSLTLPESENVERYFLDMFEQNTWYNTKRKHANILEIKQLRELISNVVTKHETQEQLPDYITKTRPNDTEAIQNSNHKAKRLRMALYSPLDIHLYDKDGNHTGPTIDENGNKTLEENIPNSYYDIIGEHKFVGWGASSDVKVELDGYDTGSYTIKLEEISATETGEKTDSHLTMKNLPTSENTKVAFEIPETGLKDITKLTADYDGDGNTDYEIEPQINGVVTLSADGGTKSSNDNKDDEDNKDEDNDEKENDSDIAVNASNKVSQIPGSESLREDAMKQSLENDAVISEKNVDISQSNIVNGESEVIQSGEGNEKPMRNILIGLLVLFLIIVSVFIFKKFIK